MQKNAIVVRKCQSHRVGIAVFAILMFVILTVIILSLHSAMALLLYIPPLFFVPLVLYYLTWSIRFEEKMIVKRVFFMEISRFSYSMLREAEKRYYIAERDFTVCMHFTNKKTVQFRLNDENSEKAVKVLLKHCSIKIS